MSDNTSSHDFYKNNTLELKIKKIFQKPAIILPIIALIGLLVRFSIFPYELPFKLDSLDIFSYAVLTSQLGHFPENFGLANNGWPGLVSIFFSFINSDNFFDYVHLQRVLSIIISVATIIPIYLLSRRFFEKTFSYVTVALFVLDFRIIIDSISGGNLPLFIFLISFSLFFFLSKNNNVIYLSFAVLSLASLIRYEGLILLIPFSIMFFIRLQKQQKIIFKYFVAISITILVLLPMAYIRIENTGQDGLTSHIMGGISYYNNELLTGYGPGNVLNDEPWTKPDQDNVTPFFISALTGLVRYLMFITVPTFMFFLPVSVFLILKNQNYKNIDNRILTLILFGLFMLVPAFYAYGRHFQETKYIFVLFPIICLFAVYSLNIIKIKNSSFVLIIIIIAILFLTLGMLNYKNINFDYDRDVFQISNFVVNNVNGINYFYPESQFIKSAEVFQQWPNIPKANINGHIITITKQFSTDDYESLEKYIIDSKNNGLSHILVDGKAIRNSVENDIFFNESKYPYLIKEFDSLDNGLKYRVKIFKIDYDLFENSDM